MAEIVKGIFQLEIEASQVEAGLKAVAGQYAKVSTEITNQNAEVKKLTDEEKKLVDARSRANNPTVIIEYDKKLKTLRESIESVTRSTNELRGGQEAVGRSATVVGNNMRKAFSATTITAASNAIRGISDNMGRAGKEVGKAEVKVKSLRAQLRELQIALTAEDLDDGEFTRLSIEAGKLKDRIADAGDAAKIFATDSPFEAVGNAIGSVGSKLLALDFDGAAQQSKLLVKASSQITFAQALTGIKQLGQTLFNIGKALLTNPLFLIGAVIGFIIAKFDALRESGGLLGTIFNGLAKIIGTVIDAGKDLLDFLGIIDSTKKSLEQLIAQQELLIKSTENFFARTIALRKANNQSTIQLENQRADAVNKALLKELKDTKDRLLEKANSYEDYFALQQKLIDIGIRASQIATEKEVRNIEVERDARLKLLELRRKISDEKNKSTEQNIDLKFDPNTATKIKAQFDLQRKELAQQAQEEKRQAAIDFVDFDGGLKAKALIDQKYSVIRKRLAQSEKNEILKAQTETALAKIEIIRSTEELLLDIAGSQNTLNEEEIAEEKLVILAKFYNEKTKLLENNITKGKQLGFSTLEDEKALSAFRKQSEAEQIKAQDNLSKVKFQKRMDELEEEERHQLEMLELNRDFRLKFFEIEEDRRVLDLKKQLEFEEEKLRILRESGEATQLELQKQSNFNAELKKKVEKAEREAERKKIEGVVDGILAIVSETLAATNSIINDAVNRNDKLISLQQQRVNDAKDIADKGNAELLQLEQERLDELNKKRERFVRVQQSLAAIEMVANAGVAIAKAAAEGGVAAPFTIATTLIALIAGLAQARAIASQAAFYEGGYTGDGNPRDESKALGNRPYTYHKKEFVFDNRATSKYRDIFEDIHKGKIDLNDWREKVAAFDGLNKAQSMQLAQVMFPVEQSNNDLSELKSQLETLTRAVKNQSMYFNIDENGFEGRLKNISIQKDYVRNTLTKI